MSPLVPRMGPMNDRPEVSVVVVFRDTVDFLGEAIESVLRQSFGDWELLLVDDGSTDGSEEVARSYDERHDSIRLLHHPGRENRGISASRNLGIAEACGSCLAQLDSDDVWLPSHLEHHVALLRANPDAAMVYAPVERWYSWSGKEEDEGRDFTARPLDGYDRYLDPPALIPLILQRPYAVPLGYVARRDAVLDVGGYEDAFRGVHDDQVFYCKFGLRHRIWVTSEASYRYRRHPGSIVWVTNTIEGDRLPHRRRFLSWLHGYLEDEGVRDERVWAALQEERWKCRYPRLAGWREQAGQLRRRVRMRIGRMRGRSTASSSEGFA